MELESTLSKAMYSWADWTIAHDLTQNSMTPEGWKWVREAYIDGFLKGFERKLTGE